MTSPQWREWCGLGALVVALFVVSVATFLQQGEDSFISFRYVDQAAAGNGLVFNVGERVEGYSNLLWVLILIPFAWVGAPLGPVSQALATLSFAALAVGGWYLAKRWLRGSTMDRWGLPWWLAVAVALDPLMHYHDDRGLETVSYASCLTGALLAIGARSRIAIPALLSGAAVLLRPEGILFAVALAPGILAGHDPIARQREENRRVWLHLALYLAVPVALFAAQVIFRRWYYGEWVPNTVLAKRRSGSGGEWQLLAYSLTRAGLPVIAIAGFVLASFSVRLRALGVAGLCLHVAAFAFQIRAGGLLNEGFRYLAPLFPLTAVGCWLLVCRLEEWLALSSQTWAQRAVGGLAVVLLLAQPVALFAPPPQGGRWLFQGNGNAPRSRFLPRLLEPDSWRLAERLHWYLSEPVFINADVGRFMADQAPPGTLVAADQMGQFGYFLGMDRPVVDLLGLMDRTVARDGLSLDYLLQRGPRFIVVEACLDTDYWPLEWRRRAHVPGLRPLLADERFLESYHPRWLLKPRLPEAQLGFLVYERTVGAPMPFEEIEVGADEATIRRVWRVF